MGKYTDQKRTDGTSHEDYQKVIQSVVDEHPWITSLGFFVNDTKLSKEEQKQRLILDQKRMFTEPLEEEFWASCAMLEHVKQTKTINSSAGSSYGLKHVVEKWTKLNDGQSTYVSNGIFIAAAVHSGFKVKQCDGNSPNAWFNMSKRSRNELDKLAG